MPEISIVIPCHNEESGIEKCLLHVVSQNRFSDLVQEVLVINDGSNDRSPEIIEAFSKKHTQVHLVTNPTNMGLAKSVNRGFSLSKGKFVFILHADCVLRDKDYLASLYRTLSETPQAAVVTSKYVTENLERTPFRNRLFLLVNFVAAGWESDEKMQDKGQHTIEIGFTEFKCDIVRKDVFLKLGGFTERLFACSEDQYSCADLRNAGYCILMLLDKAYTMDFGSHQDKISKVMSKQVTYGAATIHVLWKKKGAALGNVSFWNKNRMIRSINRITQVTFPVVFLLLAFLGFLLGRGTFLVWVGLCYLVFRTIFYCLPNRKYLFSLKEYFFLGFLGLVADILYFYGVIKGTVLTSLKKTIR